jgi:hypothetical protein
MTNPLSCRLLHFRPDAVGEPASRIGQLRPSTWLKPSRPGEYLSPSDEPEAFDRLSCFGEGRRSPSDLGQDVDGRCLRRRGAIEAADVTLMSGGLDGVATAIALSRATMRNIRQNLVFAFSYNAAGIPLAVPRFPLRLAVRWCASGSGEVGWRCRPRTGRWRPSLRGAAVGGCVMSRGPARGTSGPDHHRRAGRPAAQDLLRARPPRRTPRHPPRPAPRHPHESLQRTQGDSRFL